MHGNMNVKNYYIPIALNACVACSEPYYHASQSKTSMQTITDSNSIQHNHPQEADGC